MIKIFFFFLLLFLSGCVNKHGVSLKYYSDCKEYYDVQGFYHHECGDDDVFTYKDVNDGVDYILGKDLEEQQKREKNVW